MLTNYSLAIGAAFLNTPWKPIAVNFDPSRSEVLAQLEAWRRQNNAGKPSMWNDVWCNSINTGSWGQWPSWTVFVMARRLACMVAWCETACHIRGRSSVATRGWSAVTDLGEESLVTVIGQIPCAGHNILMQINISELQRRCRRYLRIDL